MSFDTAPFALVEAAESCMERKHFRRVILRAAAIFLLLFTAADLAFSDQWCGEEQALIASSLRLSAASNAAPEQARDDDCFCCCGHVDFTTPFILRTFSAQVPVEHIEPMFIPVAPPHLTYTPPRTA